MTITAEELARDKENAQEYASLWGGRATMAEMALKYIAEVERLREDIYDAGVLIERKDAEIARLKDLLVRAYAFVRRAGVHSLADQIDAAVPREQHLNSSTSDPSGR